LGVPRSQLYTYLNRWCLLLPEWFSCSMADLFWVNFGDGFYRLFIAIIRPVGVLFQQYAWTLYSMENSCSHLAKSNSHVVEFSSHLVECIRFLEGFSIFFDFLSVFWEFLIVFKGILRFFTGFFCDGVI
jgi:hypothetical protein